MTPVPPRPPLPQRALRVGVSGHRDLTGIDAAALTTVVADVLLRLRVALSGVHGAPGIDDGSLTRTVLVTPLAAGADQRIAEVALEQGYELTCPFPFPEAEYAQDMQRDAAALHDPEVLPRFERLRARAATVFELDGRRSTPEAPDAQERAYQAVGRLVLENSDVLVAIWDGQRSRGVGGTAQVVSEALEAGLPVVVVPPQRPGDAHLRTGAGGSGAAGVGLDGLRDVVRSLILPLGEGSAADDPHPAAHRGHHAEDFPAEQRAGYRAYLAEVHPRARAAWRRAGAAVVKAPYRWFVRGFALGRPPTTAGVPPGSAETLAVLGPLDAALARHGGWASALAGHYTDLYRGASFLNYLLGAVAVSAALLGLLATAQAFPEHVAHAIHAWLPPLELGCIAIILALVLVGGKRVGKWHERAVNYRLLAELLRHTIHLAPLGMAMPSTRPRAHLGGRTDLTATWVQAHYRALIRDLRLPTVRYTPGFVGALQHRLADGWLEDQVQYHERTDRRLEGANVFCERVALGTFLTAAGACVLHLLHLPHGDPWPALLSAIAAGAPAWGAAFHGIRSQGEFERFAERSASMARRLGAIRTDLVERRGDALAWRTLVERARTAAAAMLDELNDWQALSRAGDVPAP